MSEDLGNGNGRGKTNVSRRKFVVAAGAGGVSGLAGCLDGSGSGNGTDAGDTDSSGTTTVQYMGQPETSSYSEELNDALHEGGLSESIEVEVISGANLPDDRKNQYQQWMAGGRSEPDILDMDSGWTVPFISRGELANLSEELPEDTLNTINNDYFEMVTQTARDNNGDIHAIPLWPDFATIVYRKDLMTEAGYDPEGENWATEPMSWEEFSQIVADVQDQNDLDYGVTHQMFQGEGLSCCTFNEFLHGYGGSYFGPIENLLGPVGDRPITVDEEPALNSIRLVRALLYGEEDDHALEGYEPVISTDALEWHPDLSNQPFMDGQAVAQRNWSYVIAEAGVEDVFGEDLGVMPIPYGVPQEEAEYEGTGGSISALGGWHAALNPNSEKKEAALEVLAAMTSDAVNLIHLEQSGRIPPKQDLLQSDSAQEVEPLGRYLDTFEFAGQNSLPRPATAAWTDESTQIVNFVHQAYSQQSTPEEAMANLKEALNQIESSF